MTRVNNIEIDRLIELEGQVIEPVPEQFRAEYTYWRAAHLGNIALKFIANSFYLNARGVDYAHFWDDYEKACLTARELTSPNQFRKTQFAEEHDRVLRILAPDLPKGYVYPSMVLALNKVHEPQVETIKVIDPLSASIEEMFDPVVLSQPFSPGGGFLYRGKLTLEDIDEHSRRALVDIFSIDTA